MSWDEFIVLCQREICRFVDSQAFLIVWEDEEFIPCAAKAEQSEGHFTQKIFVHPVQNPRKSGKFWQKIQKSGQQFPNPKIQKSTENVKYMELSLFHFLL